MEIDDLKAAWQRMDHELKEQKRITAALMADRTGSLVRTSLKPLFNWQVFQIVAGISLALLGARFCTLHLDQESLLVSGVIVHVYGLALIINGVWVVTRLKEIDFGAPVTSLQKRVARLERSYVISGWALGLPWWLLWIPVSLVVVTIAGIDISGAPDSWIVANVFVGVVGIALTVAGFQWARRSTRPGVRARLDRMVSGASIDRAKQALADVKQFEQDAI